MKARRLPRPPSEFATTKKLAADIKRKSTPRGSHKLVALRDVANLMYLIVYQASRGDRDCGYFLGEFIPTLEKQCSKLEKTNETFRKAYAKFGSVRLMTAKHSALRSLIHRIILVAQAERSMLELGRHLPGLRRYHQNDKLLALPELDTSEEAIQKWTDFVVYPRLRRIRRVLSSHPVIGKLRKATDENGKFQISLLKPLIRQTVARIAAVPRRYYSSAA